MPRTGLAGSAVVATAADLADEVGYPHLTMGLLAERLGIRTPSLYKHVDGLADLQHRIAVLAMTQLGDRVRDAIGGRSGRTALAALATAFRGFVTSHPGRYNATIDAVARGPDDPLHLAGERVLEAIAAVLRGYGIPEDQTDHALRTLRSLLHGFATLRAAGGFRWSADPDETFEWLIRFVDQGLRLDPQTLTRKA